MKFGIERQGFPVDIGEVNFFFGTSVEELTHFFDIQSEIETEVIQLKNKLENIQKFDVPTKETALEIVTLVKELGRIQYDSLLGAGAYEEIYVKHPMAEVLLGEFDLIAEAIAEEIGKDTEKRKDNLTKRKAELLKKKALKSKKK